VSLIADALKRAQQGAIRRLPPFTLRRPVSGAPGPWNAGRRRRLVLAGASAAVVVSLVVIGVYLARPKPEVSRSPHQAMLIVEPVAPLAPATTPSPRPGAATSIPEVRAALQAEPTATPRPALPAVPPTPRRVDPRRDVALGRVKTALEQEARQPSGPDTAERQDKPDEAKKPPAAPVPAPPPSSPPRATEPPPAFPPTVEVHAAGKEAGASFAEALRYHQEGQLVRAIEAYEKSIAADPRNQAAYNNLGVALKDSGRLASAIEAFEKAIALDPKYEKALNNLGVIRYRKGQFEEAIGLFREALRINPANVESHTNLGVIYLKAERYDDALEAFQRALRLDPKLAEAHYNLARLWELRGQRESAQRHYEKFVDLASDRHPALVAQVRERVRSLARGR
jgi:type IV pilus biogenesis/stability protein PilW